MKKYISLFLALFLIIVPTACKGAETEPTQQPTATGDTAAPSPTSGEDDVFMFSVMIEGAEDATEFNQDYYNDMEVSTVTLSVKKGDETTQYECTGVYLRDVLSALGVTEYETVTVIAADYEKEYTKEIVDKDTTFFAVKVNGETEDCPEVLAASEGSGFTVKNVIQLIIE